MFVPSETIAPGKLPTGKVPTGPQMFVALHAGSVPLQTPGASAAKGAMGA
jgi:hypothetical protein